MKIKKTAFAKYTLFTLKLIKSKIYKKSHYLNNVTFKHIAHKLKQALLIIYSFHIHNKQILFVGTSLNIQNQIMRLVKQDQQHVCIAKKAWISGLITNRLNLKSLLMDIKIKKSNNTVSEQFIKQLKKLQHTCHLVVIIDKELEFKALEESHHIRLPIISLNTDLNNFDMTSDYKVPGNDELSKNKSFFNLFYSLLISTLKKVNTKPTSKSFEARKLRIISIFKKSKKKIFKKFKKKYFKKSKKKYFKKSKKNVFKYKK